jgi:hypothetical protein
MRRRRERPESTRARTRFILLVAGLAISAGCGWLQPAQQPEPGARLPADLATGVSVVGTPFHRILAGSQDLERSTRLLILYVRLESIADEVFGMRPSDISLVQADGTTGVALDRQRALALLERRDLVVIDADPAAWDPNGWDRAPEVQDSLRGVIRDELLQESEVQREGSVRGYVIIDMRRPQATLDGATLQVGLTRLADGAPMRQLYRLETTPVAAADTTPNAAR